MFAVLLYVNNYFQILILFFPSQLSLTCFSFDKKVLVVRATEDIPPGGGVYVSYGTHQLLVCFWASRLSLSNLGNYQERQPF